MRAAWVKPEKTSQPASHRFPPQKSPCSVHVQIESFAQETVPFFVEVGAVYIAVHILENFGEVLRAVLSCGNLNISASQEGSFVVIRFKDTGPGIPEEVRDRIFNPFFTTRNEGTGLGLAITQRIVSAHRGRIEIEETSGQGTVFALTLPCDKECIERYDD